MANLDLERRSGLPDEIAYLRASFPPNEWRVHANFGELTRFWLHVHDSLRLHGRKLEQLVADFREQRIDAQRFKSGFVGGLNQYLGHLNAHHQIEDHQYFPKFRQLDPRMVAGFDLLEADHQRIHEALFANAQAANGFLDAFEKDSDALRRASDAYIASASQLLAFLVRHLADEEDLVVPAMLHHGERSVG